MTFIGSAGRLDFDSDESFDPKSLIVAPSPDARARETSALAAVAIQPVRGSMNATLLALMASAGFVGLSMPEIVRLTGWKTQTVCARIGDCRPFLEVAPSRYQDATTKRAYTRWRRLP